MELNKTDLNMLFIDQLPNFAHLVKRDSQTKEQFLKTIKQNYCLSNPKTELFYISCKKSIFNTIRLNKNNDSILFNQLDELIF